MTVKQRKLTTGFSWRFQFSFQSIRIKIMNHLISDKIQKLIRNTGFCCFSKPNDHILLWTFYADENKGISFGFDVACDLDFFTSPQKVTYQNNYPKVNYFDRINPTTAIDELATGIIFTK